MNKISEKNNNGAFLKKYEENLEIAQGTFGVEVSKRTVMAATMKDCKIPTKTGGHNWRRGQANNTLQIGKGKKESDHGKAQGNRFTAWASKVYSKEEAAKEQVRVNDMLKNYNSFQQQEEESKSAVKEADSSLRHNEEKRLSVAEEKEKNKIERKLEKKDDYEEKQNVDYTVGSWNVGEGYELPTARRFDKKL